MRASALFSVRTLMGTDQRDLDFSNITRIAGQAENLAADVQMECGQNRLQVAVSEVSSSFGNGATSVGSTAVALRSGLTNKPSRRAILIQNLGPQPIFVGDASVTSSTGIKIPKDASVILSLSEEVTVYGIAASSSCDVRIMEL
jgi:hypothetical protein